MSVRLRPKEPRKTYEAVPEGHRKCPSCGLNPPIARPACFCGYNFAPPEKEVRYGLWEWPVKLLAAAAILGLLYFLLTNMSLI
jgi:hypothetical protein